MKIIEIVINNTYGPILTILISMLLYYVLKESINKLLTIKVGKFDVSNRHQKTLLKLFSNVLKCIIFSIAILTILNFYGINTKTVLASLGVITVVIGLALQDILKDFIAGIFILIEGNYTIGDTVEINGFKGDIIEIGLKTTKVKAETGEVKVLANRNIIEVINYSLCDTLAVADIKFSNTDSHKEIEKILNNIIDKVNDKRDDISSDAKLVGIVSLDDASVIYRITVATKPDNHDNVQRELLKETKLILDKRHAKSEHSQIEVLDENI